MLPVGTGRRLRSGRVAFQPLGFESLALRSHSTGINLLDNSAAGVILKLLRRRRTVPNIEAPDDYPGPLLFRRVDHRNSSGW